MKLRRSTRTRNVVRRALGMACGLFGTAIASGAFAIESDWLWQEFESNCVAPFIRGEPAPLSEWTEFKNVSSPTGDYVERSYGNEERGIDYLFSKQPGELARCHMSDFEVETTRQLLSSFPPVMLGQHYVNIPAESSEALLYHGLATQCGELGYGPRLLLMLFQTPGTSLEDAEATQFLAVAELPDEGQEAISCGDT